ncbi:MAG: DNA repair protein RecN [Bacteroidetes bacterium]|nr:MAG: DNA repair protein RecN [Bacteroidota bacterium]
MLTSLSIKNYALINFLTIKFEKGFSAITGETGAGKSILLGALTIILGKRADTGVLSDKTTKCVIEGEFDLSTLDLESFFVQNDLDYDTTTFIRREILPSGKSRAFINDTPVTLSVLKALGSYLVDIHSQHQTLMLSNSSFQLEALDGYLDNSNLLTSYKATFQQYSTLQTKLQTLQKQQLELKREEDFLTFQFEELDDVILDEKQFKAMEERQQFLLHSEEVMAALGMTSTILSDDELNLLDRITVLKETLSSIAGFYPKANELLNRFESVRLELKDMADETTALLTEGEANPSELSELTEKLDEIYRLQQKHHITSITELIKLKEALSNQLLDISNLEEDIDKVSRKLDTATKELQKQASALTKSRKAGFIPFTKAVETMLQRLGMKDAIFEIKHTMSDHFSKTGIDRVDFWFSTNKGVAAGEISKIASGGELSRLMLAIKSLVSEKSFLPTMVFDEIDSGVSGDIAGKVGNIMQEMARNHQLIVITHLPQIASKAQQHYKVYKQSKGKATHTNIILLDSEQRVEEIAAMLSDQTVSQAAREAARELLN